MTTLAEAHARAARNGLMLEVRECEIGRAWPGKSWLQVWLMDGRQQVSGAAMTFGCEASKARALSVCLERVYNRPARAD